MNNSIHKNQEKNTLTVTDESIEKGSLSRNNGKELNVLPKNEEDKSPVESSGIHLIENQDTGGDTLKKKNAPLHKITVLEEIEKLTLKHVMGYKRHLTPVSVLQNKWNQMFAKLVLFKGQHGHCLVPNRYEDDPALGAWVSTQRRQYKILLSVSSESTPMTVERASRLESLGFVWATNDPRHVPWEIRYKELCQYKELYGDCLVPIGYKQNVKLANWVSTQRQEYKLLREGRSSRLTGERIRLLQEINFVWEAQRGGPRKRRLIPDCEQIEKGLEYPKSKKCNSNPVNCENYNTLNTSPAVNVFFQILPQSQNGITAAASSTNELPGQLSNPTISTTRSDSESTIIQLQVFHSNQKPGVDSSIVPGAEIILPPSNNNVNLGFVPKYPQTKVHTNSNRSKESSVIPGSTLTTTGIIQSSENSKIKQDVTPEYAQSALFDSLNVSEIAAAKTLFQIEPRLRRNEKASMLINNGMINALDHNLTSESVRNAANINASCASSSDLTRYEKEALNVLLANKYSCPTHVSSFGPQTSLETQGGIDQEGIFDDAEEDTDFVPNFGNTN